MSGATSCQTLLSRMRDVVTERAEHVAVREHGREFSYAEFGRMIGSLHSRLGQANGESVGLLLERSALAYATMWASIGSGRAYVPLNTTYPTVRLRNIIEQAGITTVVCDESTRGLAVELGIDDEHLIVSSADSLCDDGAADTAWWQAPVSRKIAYVLFTSGSTGQPKGVPITYGNLLAFIDNMDAEIEYRHDDVCSQACELSFDVSMHEIFLAFLNGCTLCPARRVDLFNPVHYIKSRSITVWIAVPSLARIIMNNGVEIGDGLDGVRISIFNGEALTAGVARAWHDVAPNSLIWNTYGPTECTVAVTTQPWADEASLVESDIVSIGTPFSDCQAGLLIEGDVVATTAAVDGNTGELLLATPQRFAGYTDSSLPSPFVSDESGTTFYRTGDRVLCRDGRYYYLGRVDYQVKIGGHRIELLEIEHQLRHVLGSDALAVIAYPSQLPTELVLFIEGTSGAPEINAETLGLPAYMLPKRCIVVESLPTNAHGKLDRTVLQSLAGTDK